MVPAAKLLLCVLEMHVFRVFCVPASNADDLDTRQVVKPPRIGPNCVELSRFAHFLPLFDRFW
ncbi:MAG: hypothetical protein EB075_12650 [Bacteroidetes bacterium]|nr:hypothetical protein [Bacteroidota bacterium]